MCLLRAPVLMWMGIKWIYNSPFCRRLPFLIVEWLLHIMTTPLSYQILLLLIIPYIVFRHSLPHFSLSKSTRRCDCTDCIIGPNPTPLIPELQAIVLPHTPVFEEGRAFLRAYNSGELDRGRGIQGHSPLIHVAYIEELEALLEFGGDIAMLFDADKITDMRAYRKRALARGTSMAHARLQAESDAMNSEGAELYKALAEQNLTISGLFMQLGPERQARFVREKQASQIMEARLAVVEEKRILGHSGGGEGACELCNALQRQREIDEGEEGDGGIDLLVGVDGEFYSIVEGKRRRYEPRIKWL